ncbi:MAG TPA: FAD-dependent oxidoreductase [Acidimicrobiia bacterium]
MRVAIVGAGMSGLVAANDLVAAGHDVVVFDKGRAVGGRMASKRFAGARFDHGAQHFSVRSDAFAEFVREASFAGVVGVWYEGGSLTTDNGVEPRHRGVPAMRSICEYLAEGLDVRTGAMVRAVRVGEITLDSGEPFESDAVVVTAPIPQALGLIEPSSIAPDDRAKLEAVEYDPCIAVMAVLETDPDLPDGHLAPDSDLVAWIADNRHKGISEVPAVTIHSTPGYARSSMENDSSVWLDDLLGEFQRLVGCPVVDSIAHRWRYSMPTNPLDSGCMELGSGVWLAGEAFSGARIEGAFTSGLAVAAALIGS